MKDLSVKDCTIIGGGPAGLYAAFYAGMRDLSVRIVENRSELGGKLHFYPEKTIWDIGGMKPTLGFDAMKQMIEQAKTFEPEIAVNQKIVRIERLENGLFRAESQTGEEYFSRTLIVATGGGIFTPKRLPGLVCHPYENHNLHYTIYRTKHFERKKVVIVGGGNAAVDWANELKDHVDELHLIHRSGTFRAHESQVRKLKDSDVTVHANSLVKAIIPDSDNNKKIKAVKVVNSETKKEFTLDLDEMVVNIGFDTENNFHQKNPLNLTLIDQYYIEGTAQTQTSAEGIFAIGDILAYKGKVRLISGAYNDAINAVNQVKEQCQPSLEGSVVMSSLHEGLQRRSTQ